MEKGDRTVGIRGRLLLLAIGIAVPLALVGVADLRGMWRTSRLQLDESVKQQAELAAVAFERWVDAQRQPLSTLAAMVEAQGPGTPQALEDNLRFIVSTRPHWVDLRVVDAAGNSLTAEPSGIEPPPPALVEHLVTEAQQRNDWVVVTDRTGSEERPVFAIAAPVRGGGAVIARVDGAVVSELFRDIEFPERGVIAVFDTENRLLYRRPTTRAEGDPAVDSSPLFAAFGDRRVAVVEVESPYDGIRRVYGLARAGATGSIVVVGVPSTILYEPAWRQLMRHVIFSLLALVCAVIAALSIERSIVRPIERLRQSAQALGAGDLETRAPVKGSREIVELGAAFNRMAAQIAEREERLTELDHLKSEFVSSVSHELRTPLTTIKTLTRVLERGGQTEEERREYLETIAVECDRQIDLVLNLLDLSRIESGAYKVSRTRVNPAEVVAGCVMIERHAAAARDQTLEAELPAEVPAVRADGGALRRVLCGLVENAIKYTPEGGSILIKAAPAGDDEVAISVADTGCGILTEDLPHVFEKFYRGRPGNACADDSSAGTSSAHTEAPGIGLGLYIARSIIEQLGGRIIVESPGGRGTVFTLFLPVWSDEPSAGAGYETSQEERDVEAFTRG